jgi:hypothetical protein
MDACKKTRENVHKVSPDAVVSSLLLFSLSEVQIFSTEILSGRPGIHVFPFRA